MSPVFKTDDSTYLVSTEWLAQNLENPDIRIVEVGNSNSPEVYAEEGHIPGAVEWPWKETLWHSTDREFTSPEAFKLLMEQSGVGDNRTIIFYSNSVQYNTYALWVCHMRGHDKAKILHGSRNLWIQENRPLETKIPLIEPANYTYKDVDNRIDRMGRTDVLAGLHKPDRTILDVRAPEEYYGERVNPKENDFDHGAERKGRIPGAVHLYFRELLNEDDTFKTKDELQQEFLKRGVTPEKEIVTYCRLSHRASLVWFVAKHILNYPNVKVYDGSWTEWGSIVGFPVEKD